MDTAAMQATLELIARLLLQETSFGGPSATLIAKPTPTKDARLQGRAAISGRAPIGRQRVYRAHRLRSPICLRVLLMQGASA